MFVVVAYDVSTETRAGRRRLRRVAQACKDYGQRVQKSVFECILREADWVKLRHRLMQETALTEDRSEEHTSELQSPCNLVCRFLLEKQNALMFGLSLTPFPPSSQCSRRTFWNSGSVYSRIARSPPCSWRFNLVFLENRRPTALGPFPTHTAIPN